MKKITFLLLALLVQTVASEAGAATLAKKKKVLVFYKTAGFRHGSIPDGIKAIQQLGVKNKFGVDTTNDASKFTLNYLKQYNAVVFLNTTGDILNAEQQSAFESYIRDGGGFVGIHAATDCEYNWQWYGNLVGGYFGGHPAPQEALLHVSDHEHQSTKHLPAEWRRKDEWYNFKWLAPDLKVLISIDEATYSGGKNGANHPVAWYHEYDGGRAFYTALGHTNESFSEPEFLLHLSGGIKYAAQIKK